MNTTDKKFRRRAEARPDEVLDAALELFIEKGFASTRVEDIAKRAGLSKGTVYLYFPSKEALLEGLVRRVARLQSGRCRIWPSSKAIRACPSPCWCIRCKICSDPNNLAVPRLILREIMNFPAIAELYRREVLGKVIPALTALVARGVASGQLRKSIRK
ncbi:helix-turn-helix domain containing protein [Devosia sp. LjRoot16]|uniref:TetR/AcrR family transcriptional regulator n=1 Tax=Devosia sp. LjRoot16 TaxID=3342271 RepID=UPI003ECEF188